MRIYESRTVFTFLSTIQIGNESMPIIPYEEHVRIVLELQERIRALEEENETLRMALDADDEEYRINELADFAEDNGKEILSGYLIVSIEEH